MEKFLEAMRKKSTQRMDQKEWFGGGWRVEGDKISSGGETQLEATYEEEYAQEPGVNMSGWEGWLVDKNQWGSPSQAFKGFLSIGGGGGGGVGGLSAVRPRWTKIKATGSQG